MENSELQKEKDAFQTMVSNSAYEYAKKYSTDRETVEEAFETGAYFMQEIVRKKDSATIVRLSMENKTLKENGFTKPMDNGYILAEKIDQYVELVSKLDDKISDLEFQKQELNKQLTQIGLRLAELTAENKILKSVNDRLLQALPIHSVGGLASASALEVEQLGNEGSAKSVCDGRWYCSLDKGTKDDDGKCTQCGLPRRA